jgi:NAD(P)H-flavin reductase
MSTAAKSPGFMCKLKDCEEVAEGTMVFQFEKPSGWTFKAGQYLDMRAEKGGRKGTPGCVFERKADPREASYS